MPRSVTIDGVHVLPIKVHKDPAGAPQIYAEYQVKSGTHVMETKNEEITMRLSTAQSNATAAFSPGGPVMTLIGGALRMGGTAGQMSSGRLIADSSGSYDAP